MNVAQLIECYQTDKDSPFHKLRYVTRQSYGRMLKVIARDLGHIELSALKMRDIKQQHDKWSTEDRVTQAHALVTIMRVVFGFGASMLEDADCLRIREVFRSVRFKGGRARTERLTPELADAVRDEAIECEYYCIALAQAFQQDCALRQKDVIGEWIPVGEPVESSILSADGKMKWVRGITREEIDADLVLRHVTSKRNQPMSFQLKNCPSVMEEWDFAPASGPMIIDPETELPYEAWKYRRIWRRIADRVGVPKGVWNMDSRSGRITDVLSKGATLEDARKLAGHKQQTTTSLYSRGEDEAIDRVLRMTKPADPQEPSAEPTNDSSND